MNADDVYAALNRKIKNLQASGGGITDYSDLNGKPSINGVQLVGDLSLEDIGVTPVTSEEIDAALGYSPISFDMVFDKDGSLDESD